MNKNVQYVPGVVKTKSGKQVTTQVDAWSHEFDCGCGIDCCSGRIAISVNDANGTAQYPGFFEFIYAAGVISMRITVETPSGTTVKEVELS